ncbi:MAG TPA: hypothetical protein VF306_04635 [Pirellulales bacterium]
MAQQEQIAKARLVGSAKHLVRPSRAAEAIALLDRWLRDESDYDEKTWPELKAALDRDRLSERKLFDE